MTQQEIDELRKLCAYALESRREIVERISAWLDRKEAEMVRNVKYAGDRLP